MRPELVDALLALDPAGVRAAAEQWVRTDEMLPLGVDEPGVLDAHTDEVHELLIGAITVMQTARDDGREVFTLVVL